MEQREIKEIAASALTLAVAFSIVFAGGDIRRLTIELFAMSFVTVSLGFILHELGHRYIARRFGYFAEYRMWVNGLILALLSSFFGLVFAAPGAVYIQPRADLWGSKGRVTKEKEGVISLFGPIVNMILAAAFVLLGFLVPAYKSTLGLGFTINVWLALFNMIPIPPLDGSKVFAWDKKIWSAVSGLLILAYFFF